jgi:hypothetical protein
MWISICSMSQAFCKRPLDGNWCELIFISIQYDTKFEHDEHMPPGFKYIYRFFICANVVSQTGGDGVCNGCVRCS